MAIHKFSAEHFMDDPDDMRTQMDEISEDPLALENLLVSEPEPTVTIYMEWTQASPDNTSYKQLSPTFQPKGIMIAVDVPKSLVREVLESGVIILKPEGAAYAMRQVLKAIDKTSKPY
jgi:hypothetical protein